MIDRVEKKALKSHKMSPMGKVHVISERAHEEVERFKKKHKKGMRKRSSK